MIRKKSTDDPLNGAPRETSFLSTWSFPIICFAAIFLTPVIMAAVSSLKVHSNDVKQWLPKNFAAAKDYDWFIERFGVDEMIVISWDGCRLGEETVNEFRVFLEREENADGKKIFERVVTAETMIGRIENVGIGNTEARQRIEGLLIGPDGKTTCILAFPNNDLGMPRIDMVQSVYDMAKRTFGFKPEDLKMAGPTVDGAVLDIEGRRAMDNFMWITVAIVFLLSWWRLQDFALALTVLGFALCCGFVALSILYWTGGKMNLTMVMMPTLTFIAGVSASIHMASYYRKALQDGEGRNSADAALRAARVPIALCSITTAIGLASLGTSQVTPIRTFGIYSAIGIMAGLPIILLLMPAVMYQFRGRMSKRLAGMHRPSRLRQTGDSDMSSLIVDRIFKHHWFVTVPTLIVVFALSAGIIFLEGSVKIQNRFAERTKIIQDYKWLEENLGPLVPLEIVVTFDETNPLPSWQQMLLVERIERDLLSNKLGQASLSAATFKPQFPQSNNLAAKLQQQIGIDKWQNEEANLIAARLIKNVDQSRLWRISLRVGALNDIDYGYLLDSVQQRVTEEMERFRQPGVSAKFTGAIPMFYHAQHQILSDLKISFLTAFIFISIVLMWLLKSVGAGLVAMIPNIFPPMFVFGTMGWLGLPIEIGSVMTASVAIGIAVDETIHFLTWYRRGIDEGQSNQGAIQFAFSNCAKPMIDTTLICGFGVGAFMFSDFMPTVRFSRLLFVLLTAALIGDLILLPAILAGPAGAMFRKRSKKSVPPALAVPRPKSRPKNSNKKKPAGQVVA